MALIFGFSSASTVPALPGGLSDKTVHFLLYLGLGVLLVRALGGPRWSRPTTPVVMAAAGLAALYGVSDEGHQLFVTNRRFEGLDLVADAAGAAVGAAGVYVWGIITAFFCQGAARS